MPNKCDSDLTAIRGSVTIAITLIIGIVLVLIVRPATETTLVVALVGPLGGVISNIGNSVSNYKRNPAQVQDVNVTNPPNDPVPTVATPAVNPVSAQPNVP